MKVFLTKVFLLTIIFYCTSVFLQIFLDYGLRKTSFSVNYNEWNDIINSKVNADIIIQGSSRAWVEISPKAFENAFNMSCYNIGIDGYSFLMQYYRFKLLIENNTKPKYIIQILDDYTLTPRPDLYMLEQFIPYLDNKIVRKATSYYKGLDNRDYYLPFYKYTHSRDIIIFGLYGLLKGGISNTGKYKGFASQQKIWDSAFYEFKLKYPNGIRYKVDSQSLKLMEEFLKFCKINNTKVIFIYAPEFIEAQKFVINRDSIFNIYTKLAIDFNLPFLNFSKAEISNNKTYFYNSQHLNSEGAYLFNDQLLDSLKNYIK